MVAQCAGNLLIVDDEPSVRRALERLLRSEGYVIHSARDAAAAERILDNDAVDVILCDQDMPGKSGIEFLSGAAKRFPAQRRLMISGRFQSDDVAHAIDSGTVHKFMMKPWDDAILKADLRASFRHVMASYGNGDPSGDATPEAQRQARADFDEDRRLSQELHSAAGNGSLSLHYQPQIDLKSASLCGVEALLRWESSIGAIRPDRFVALAERGGAMAALTHWVVCEVCFRAQQWQPAWPNGRIGLNVSPTDLHDDVLVEYLERQLGEHGIPPQSLQIEVTESQVLNCDDGVLGRLNRLSNMGVELAIDDFGAGATTLAYLADLPFTTLKLDRSLTQQLGSARGDMVVEKVLEMARGLDMKTTVEGIETEQQAVRARTLGADAAQGYFFSRPISRDQFRDWIANERPGARG